MNDAAIHQPNNPYFGNKKVAKETIDPRTGYMDHPQCEEGYYCRYSDSAFAKLNSDKEIDLGEVAKPEDVEEKDVSPAGTTFKIKKESSSFKTEDTIYYVGKETGWRTARVLDTCIETTLKRKPLDGGVGVRIVCTGKAQITDGGPKMQLSRGDSGGPVMLPTSGNNVELLGIVTSGWEYNFNFSKVGLIYFELGRSSRWDSCVRNC